jgi:hypothetical protein
MPSEDEDYDEDEVVTTETSEDVDDCPTTESDEGGATVHTVRAQVHVPQFLQTYLDKADKSKEMASELAKLEWLPAALQREVMEQCHKRTGNSPTVDNARDMQDFSAACKVIFCTGRVYASHVQLDQVADMFLKSWGVKKTHPGQSIWCFFLPTIHKKDRLTRDETKRRKNDASPKNDVCCPFRINYSLIGQQRRKKHKHILPKIYHRIKITTTCFEHTCNPSTISHRVLDQGKVPIEM